MPAVIAGVHTIVSAYDAEAARAFFRDVLGFDAVDAGDGWLIFALPPGELAVHPGPAAGHELFFMCRDIEATVEELKRRGVEFSAPVSDEGWGLLTRLAGARRRRDRPLPTPPPEPVGRASRVDLMPESPEELHARVANALRMPPVEEWETFPFDGDMRPRPLLPPVSEETPRRGDGGVDCDRCAAPDDDYFWTNERWRLRATRPRPACRSSRCWSRASTYAEPGDLPDELAAELGVLLAPDRACGPRDRRDRPRARVPLGRRRRAPALVVHGPPCPAPAADRQLRRDLGRHPAAGARGPLARGRRSVAAALE